MPPFARSLKYRDKIVFPFFFFADLHYACFEAASRICSFKQMPVVDFDLFTPPPSSCSRCVYRACAGWGGVEEGGGGVCVGLHVWGWCQLYSVSKDRCAEDRVCHEYRHRQEKDCAVPRCTKEQLGPRLLHTNSKLSCRSVMWKVFSHFMSLAAVWNYHKTMLSPF